jgi:hypothetical protein
MTDDADMPNGSGRANKTQRKGPIERELRLWGHSLRGNFTPWTELQKVILDYSRLLGLMMCNAKYRYQEGLIAWALKESRKSGNPADFRERDMIQVRIISTYVN